jgi:signal transduction histidine kinase
MTNARDLMGELDTLDDDVKRLVKTERRLHDAQKVIEAQLDRFKALSDLSLRVGRADSPEAILDAALGTLLQVLLIDQAAAFVASCSEELAPAAFKAQPGLAPPFGRQWTARLTAPQMRSVVFSPGRGGAPPVEDLRRCFASVATHFAGDRTDAETAAVEIALPLRCRGVIPACEKARARGDSALLALIVLRKTAKPSFHEHAVSEDDLPFLELVASHTETALENALLCRELSSSASQLERRVIERTADLARANRELARNQTELAAAVAFREQVLAIVGHDLRNPLGAISLSASMALRRGDQLQDLSQETRRALGRIDAAATRMVEMIGTLLDFAQSRFRARLPISPEAMSLEDVVRKVVDELLTTNPGRPIELHLDGSWRGLWDPARIAQVVSNLVGNALTHGAATEPVRVSLSSADDAVVLEVRNRGPLIPAELMPVLFEPFRRGRTSAKTSRLGGLGLGLYIAHQIVVGHGGTIVARSTADEGTTFTVRLPWGERARAAGG